ncbi:hypothetical protein TSAR_004219 [Trichomalopsis sarcophagae]|uniref:Ionotropic glutamate receptor C-terminal domain-containing protein n=1 Tax=Trichomalopsis sarcophagae TaxID=543379 RepID=A0A232EVN9_9HYME|nr:hypothetical protein TSAR_004219 [Trichomalopsis sarcophagae]
MNATAKPTYRVITIPKPPFVIYDPDSNWYGGFLVDLLNEIARRLNFRYEIEMQEESDYGFMDDQGNWNGLMRDLKEGKADIGLAAVSVMSERMKVVDFTEPIYKPTGISVLMQKPISKTDFYRFLTVLELDVWLCIIGAYLFTSLLLWIFDTWSPYSYRNSKAKHKDDTEKRIFGCKESLWFCLTSLTPQGGGEAPKNLSGRLVAATWWLFGFIIIASYTANLAAFLTISKFEKTIETFDDLISQYKYAYTCIQNSSTNRYFQRMNDIEYVCYEKWKDMTLNDSLSPYERAQLAVWEYPLSDKFIKIYSAISHYGMVASLQDGLDKFNSTDSRFALITEASDVQYQAMIDCSVKEIGPEFSKKPYAIVLQKNSPLTKEFNRVIYNMKNDNWLEALTDKWWKYNPLRQRCHDKDEMNNGIIFENIGGVFVLIGVGIISAFSTLVYEYFYFKCLRDKFERIFEHKLKAIFRRQKNFARSISVKP